MDQNEKVEMIWHTLFWKEWLGFLFSLECSSNRSFLCQQDFLSVFYQSNLTNVVSTDVFQYLGITLFSCPDHISASNDFFFFSKYNKSFFLGGRAFCVSEQGVSAGRQASANQKETTPRYGFPKNNWIQTLHIQSACLIRHSQWRLIEMNYIFYFYFFSIDKNFVSARLCSSCIRWVLADVLQGLCV